MIIDILIGIAHSGGVENIINRFADYFINCGNTVRIVQLIDAGKNWVTAAATYDVLSNGNIIDDSLARKYREYLDEKGYPDIVLATGWPILCTFSKWAVSDRSIRIVYWPHMPIEQYENFGGINELEYADAYVAISDQIAQSIDEAYPEKIIHRINNGVDFGNIKFSNKRDKKHLAFVGRFDEVKNIDYIINTFSMLSDQWRLSLVGDGPLAYQCYELAENMGLLDRVKFYGWLERPWDVLKDAGFLVMASDYEGNSLVTIEALCSGMGVITTPVGISGEIIIPGENGYIYSIEHDHSLAELLESEDIELCNPEFCRESVICYDMEYVGEVFLQILNDLV